MKVFRFFLPLFLTASASLIGTTFFINELTQINAENNQQALKDFILLAERCKASEREASDTLAIQTFREVTTFYKEHATALEKAVSDTTDAQREETETLAKECSAVLTKAISQRTRAAVRGVQVSLPDAMYVFSRSMPQFLDATTTERLVQRIFFLSLIESVFIFCQEHLKEQGPRRKKIAPLADRLKNLVHPTLTQKNFYVPLALATGKAAANGLVNEFVPRGIHSYFQRFCENIMPPFIGLLIVMAAQWRGKGRNDKLIMNTIIRVGRLLVLSRFFLPRGHALHAFADVIAKIFPFVFNPTTEIAGFDLDNYDENTVLNALFDGALGAAIFSGVPHMVRMTLPQKSSRMHPERRRAVVKKMVRNVADAYYKAVTQTSFNDAGLVP